MPGIFVKSCFCAWVPSYKNLGVNAIWLKVVLISSNVLLIFFYFLPDKHKYIWLDFMWILSGYRAKKIPTKFTHQFTFYQPDTMTSEQF